jgi:RNA polymerase sigma-70 factor (ECF subfamily)
MALSPDVPVDTIDHELLTAARRGSQPALGRLFEIARAHLLFLAENELPSSIRAKIGASDIVQDTAYDAHRGFAGFSGTTSEEFIAWLRAILQHNVIDAVRRFEGSRKRDVGRELTLRSHHESGGNGGDHVPISLCSKPPDRSAIRREDSAAILAAVARLPDDYRMVLELRYWEGLTFQEIGVRVGRSGEAVRKLWYRGVRQLQCDLCECLPCETTTSPQMPR